MVFPWHKNDFSGLLARKHRLPHALLLRGPQGIGKMAFAEAVAEALLCETPVPDGSACGRCRACGWMGQGGHPDFRRLEPGSLSEGNPEEPGEKKGSSQIVIEQVRALADFINVSSHRGGAKVVLVHPAESLNPNAANALLKSLEEPPPGTYFLLVAHRWQRLLPTIRSRCQQVTLALPSAAVASEWLAGQGLSDPDVALAHAGGAPLQAAQLGEEYWGQRVAFLKAISAASFDPLALAEQLRDQAPELSAAWLQKWSYDVVAHKTTGQVRYNPDFARPIAAVAARVGLLEATRLLRHAVRLQRLVHHPLNARLFHEDLLLAYAALLRGRRLDRAA